MKLECHNKFFILLDFKIKSGGVYCLGPSQNFICFYFCSLPAIRF